jgi:2'-5' RNA ligase
MSDTTTALAFILPTNEKSLELDSIRNTYDKAAKRWPPHINFLFPFVSPSQFEQIKVLLGEIESIGSFDIKFNKLSYFSQGKGNITFHLGLDDESEHNLQKIYAAIRRLLPMVEVKRNDFHPHLTLGQCKLTEWNNVLCNEMTNWLGEGITVRFDKITFVHRNMESMDKMVEVSSVCLQIC